MDICILNSGFGSRLERYTRDTPKGLIPLKGSETILGRQIRLLSTTGEHRFVITTGYLANMIDQYIPDTYPGLNVSFKHNIRYSATNYITSMDLLKDSYTDDLVLLHGDLVFEQSVARDVIGSAHSVVVIDSTLPLPEKDFKARIKQGKVVEIGVNVFGPDCYACQPLYHLMKQDWNLWQQEIHDFCIRGNDTVYAEEALNAISDRMELYPLDVTGRLCMEIDNEADLLRARHALEYEHE